MVLKRLIVKNFGSIEDMQIDIAPITILFGQPNSGKTTVLFAPIFFCEVAKSVLNPYKFQNIQNIPIYFNGKVIFYYDKDKKAEIQLMFSNEHKESVYGMILEKGNLKIWRDGEGSQIIISIPFNIKKPDFKYDYGYFRLLESLKIVRDEHAYIIPSLIPEKVSIRLEKITGKIVKDIYPAFQVIDKFSYTYTLNNEGAGFVQIIYLLSNILGDGIHSVFIEQPENRLHPKTQYKLVQEFIDIVKTEGKTLIIETNSEIIVSSFLSFVAEKRLSPQDIKCWHFRLEGDKNVITERAVNEKGRMEKHFFNFIEVENIKKMLGI